MELRVFRIKARNDKGMVVNSREYAGIDKLRMYGNDLYRRYNRYATAELYEIDSNGKWIQIHGKEDIRKLINPYASDLVEP